MTAVELDPTTAAWVQAAHAATTEINRLTEIRDRACEHIQQAIGDHQAATINGQPAVTWAWSKPSQRLDRKAMEADLGTGLVAKYLRENKPARPFKLLTTDPA